MAKDWRFYIVSYEWRIQTDFGTLPRSKRCIFFSKKICQKESLKDIIFLQTGNYCYYCPSYHQSQRWLEFNWKKKMLFFSQHSFRSWEMYIMTQIPFGIHSINPREQRGGKGKKFLEDVTWILLMYKRLPLLLPWPLFRARKYEKKWRPFRDGL